MVKIKSRKSLGIQSVYDIGVERDHNFLLANGLVASNCFNKSHSTAYGYVTYQTAYLKANYPVEYMAALLTSNSGDRDKVAQYIANCQELNVTVEGPDINRSQLDFTPVDHNPDRGKILFGLSAVKTVGTAVLSCILAERDENGPFKSLADFCNRINLHTVKSSAVEALIKCGAFDKINPNRKQLTLHLPLVIKWAQDRAKEQEMGQLNLFDQLAVITATDSSESAPTAPATPDFPLEEKLQFEKELLGFYVSEHPLKYADKIAVRLGIELVSLAQLSDQRSRSKINAIVMLTEVKQILTKKDERRMAFLQMEDLEGKAEGVVFPDTYEQIHTSLIPDTPVIVTGKVDRRDDRTQIIVEEAKLLSFEELKPVEPTKPAIASLVLLELTSDRVQDEAQLRHLQLLLKEHSGDKANAIVPVMAIIVTPDRQHRAGVICGRDFWVEDCETVVNALNSANFPAMVYTPTDPLDSPNGMPILPPSHFRYIQAGDIEAIAPLFLQELE